MKLVVIIPALNEEKTIADVIKNIPRNIEGINKIEIVVVDDGSTDNTAKVAMEAGAEVVSHGVNRGVGVAFKTGLKMALEKKADIMVQIDGDGQFDPGDIPRLIKPIIDGIADFVSASRFKNPEYTPPDISAVKKWGNKRVAWLVSRIAGQKFYDVSCGFRAYSKEALLRITPIAEFTYTQEVFLELAFKKLRIEEIPVKVRGQREHGKSRIASNIPIYAYQISKIILRSFRDYKPFTFFGLIGLVFFLSGLPLEAVPVITKIYTGSFTPYKIYGAAGITMQIIGILLFIVAVLADINTRHRILLDEILYFERRKNFYDQ